MTDMPEKIGQVSRNQFEDIWISLAEIRGKPHLELRLYARAASGAASPLPGREAILLPIDQVPEFIRALKQAQDHLIRRGLLHIPSAGFMSMEGGEVLDLSPAARPPQQPSRRHPRASVNLTCLCRSVDTVSARPGQAISGEIRDVSLGGAQAWMTRRLPRFSQVEVLAMIEGDTFRARAEVVGVAHDSKKGSQGTTHRHNLKWLALDAEAKEVLQKVIPT